MDALPAALSGAVVAGPFSAAGVATGALGSAGGVASGVTVFGRSPLSVLPPAVMRSVSVTDFLSSPAFSTCGGFWHSAESLFARHHRYRCQLDGRRGRRYGVNRLSTESSSKISVIVLVSAQKCSLQLLDVERITGFAA